MPRLCVPCSSHRSVGSAADPYVSVMFFFFEFVVAVAIVAAQLTSRRSPVAIKQFECRTQFPIYSRSYSFAMIFISLRTAHG